MLNIQSSIRGVVRRVYLKVFPVQYKETHELRYWNSRVAAERVLRNDHYQYFYSSFFGLDLSFYKGKKILDVGCGPRGSLEWATEASERIGLDPLASEYLKLGANRHKMRYVDAPSERMPFEKDHFDVVCSFNSLDHVADLGKTVAEIKRVVKPAGLLLLIVEINHPVTANEPIVIKDVAPLFADAFDLSDLRRYEIGDHDIYGQLRKEARFDDDDVTDRPAIVAAKFTKRPV
jgi:ubiquinone/menaquinone biosynthesis C-methylase UbiE